MGGPAVELAVLKKGSAINVIVSGGVPHFAVLKGAYGSEMSGSPACAVTPFRRTVDIKFPTPFFLESDRT
jgi:hypothetical protein